MHSSPASVLLFLAILLLISGEPIKDGECQLERQEETALDLEGAAGLYQVTAGKLHRSVISPVGWHRERRMHDAHTLPCMHAFSNGTHDGNVRSRFHILSSSFPLV
jgi:hypothetical protein